MKRIFLAIAAIAMAVLLLCFPSSALESAQEGLDLWMRAVIPSLLPFMVASYILLETGVVRLIAAALSPITRALFAAPGESAYIFFASGMSGYPLGAALTAELFASKQITRSQAHHILRFTSMCGPVFMTGAVASAMLSLPEAGIYLAASHYIAVIILGILLGIIRRFSKQFTRTSPPSPLRSAVREFRMCAAHIKPAGEVLSSAIEKSVFTQLKIGGFLILFSVVSRLLSDTGIMDLAANLYAPIIRCFHIPPLATNALLRGGIELANGCSAAALLPIDIHIKLPLIASIIAFGGLCVYLQTQSVCIPHGLKPKRFFLAKGAQSLLSYVLCAAFLRVFPLTAAASSIGSHAQIKTTAFAGVAFAVVSIFILFYIKYKMRRSAFTLSR